MFKNWLLSKLRPPVSDFKTVGSAFLQKLKPPTDDFRTVKRAVSSSSLLDKLRTSPVSYASKRAPALKYMPSELKKGVKATTAQALKGLTLGYVKPKFGLKEKEIEKYKVPGTIAEMATWLIPFGIASRGIVGATKIALKVPVAKTVIAKAVKKSPQIANLIKQVSIGGATFGAIEGLRKPEEGEKRAEMLKSGALIGAAFPFMGAGLKTVGKFKKPISNKIISALGKAKRTDPACVKTVRTAVKENPNAIPERVIFSDTIENASKQYLSNIKKGVHKQLEGFTHIRANVNGKIIESKAAIKGAKPFTEESIKKFVSKEISPIKKVIQTIKEAKPLRGEQERIYTEARGKKFISALEVGKKVKGEKGFYAELGMLKGKIKKVQFEEIKSKIGQDDIDDLFNQIKKTPALDYLETFPARQGLTKLLGGQVPTEGEIRLLRQVFGSDFSKALLNKRGLFAKLKEAGYQLANVPRSLMASFDLSAPLRQGIFLAARYPKKFISAFAKQFKYFVSEKAYTGLNKEIASRANYKLMRKNKLALTELVQDLGQREEIFMSNWAEKIPLVGKVVRASGRAYTGFLNKLRADVFDGFVKQGKTLGIKDPKFLKDAASFVNHATGRGSLGQLENSAVALNTVFFSPRLTMSRLNLLNPAYYVNLHPTVRKEAIKSLLTFAGVAATVSTLAKMGGAEVGIDPRNADFAKIKVGNKRFDILGGFQQPIRLAAQLISGEIISSTTGKTITLGEGYKPLTRFDIALRFFEYKTSPIASFALALTKGKTAIGEKMDVPKEVANRFIPMVAQDMYELYEEEGATGTLSGVPAIFGVGVMTYGGVQSYGLKGKEYPKLNEELNRLKTSMGFPSTQAFGVELSNKEYKELKEKSGKAIAGVLTEIIADEDYQKLPDFEKVKLIKKISDKAKKRTKDKLFPDKKIINELKKRIVAKGIDETEAEELAKKIYEKEFSPASQQ